MVKYKIVLLAGMILAVAGSQAQVGNTVVAKWKGNRAGAMAVMFDDSYTSHADIAVPEMAARGLYGTFFVNPGNASYQSRLQIWEEFVPVYGHELANHTMTHTGATDFADADWEIGECARTIWRIRPGESTQLLTWCQPGGTTWNITSAEMAQLLNTYHCISRHSDYSGATESGTDAATLKALVDRAISTQDWVSWHTHSIRDSGSGDLSIQKGYFVEFLDYLASKSDQVWNQGYITIYQYREERATAQVTVTEATNSLIRLTLTCSKDTALYKEPLTLITNVPADWDLCRVTQQGRSTIYTVDNTDKCMYDVRPGAGEIRLEKSKSPCVVTQPEDATIYEKEKVSFSVAALGTGTYTYQWQRNGQDIGQATASTLVLDSPAAADSGAQYRCIVTTAAGKDTSRAAVLHVKTWPLLSGLVWNAEDGIYDKPFVLKSYYLYHEPAFVAEKPEEGGKASYFFTITTPGQYVVGAKVHAFLEGFRSMYVNIDAEPTDPTMFWDIVLTSGFEWRTASWRGSGTVEANEFAPKVFDLTAGDHHLILRGKDQKVKIDSVMVAPYQSYIADGPTKDVIPEPIACWYDPGTSHFYYRLNGPGRRQVTLKVNNGHGNQVATVAEGRHAKGAYQAAWHAVNQASGVYIFQLKAGRDQVTGKCILLPRY